jgi:hypothetical protein
MTEQHTPGPWRWEVNRSHKSVKLCGGPPNRGFGRYDLTVMDFRRYGMNGAAPVFWHWDYDKFVGQPQRADDLAKAVEGREHHASWFADINHPDARLIAAAPELLQCAEMLAALDNGRGRTFPTEEDCAFARAVIAKAKGTDNA